MWKPGNISLELAIISTTDIYHILANRQQIALLYSFKLNIRITSKIELKFSSQAFIWSNNSNSVGSHQRLSRRSKIRARESHMAMRPCRLLPTRRSGRRSSCLGRVIRRGNGIVHMYYVHMCICIMSIYMRLS